MYISWLLRVSVNHTVFLFPSLSRVRSRRLGTQHRENVHKLFDFSTFLGREKYKSEKVMFQSY